MHIRKESDDVINHLGSQLGALLLPVTSDWKLCGKDETLTHFKYLQYINTMCGSRSQSAEKPTFITGQVHSGLVSRWRETLQVFHCLLEKMLL